MSFSRNVTSDTVSAQRFLTFFRHEPRRKRSAVFQKANNDSSPRLDSHPKPERRFREKSFANSSCHFLVGRPHSCHVFRARRGIPSGGCCLKLHARDSLGKREYTYMYATRIKFAISYLFCDVANARVRFNSVGVKCAINIQMFIAVDVFNPVNVCFCFFSKYVSLDIYVQRDIFIG